MSGRNYEVPHCGAFSTPHSHPSWFQLINTSLKLLSVSKYTLNAYSSKCHVLNKIEKIEIIKQQLPL